ncbi:MAG: ABC transporter ATP-binding protein [Bacteroidales bacterium]|nr:ABC transporter ATP-binding protein [Bacteroidales bacterium]
MSTAIEFNNISKQYRLGLVSTKTLSHDLNRWWTVNVRGKEDPYLQIGSVNDRSTAADSDYVWALRDIDFKVEQGDVLGIIGKNGAGKSTLLKLLSRVTAPTTGTIRARGRIASLLEVGTGFHPEMTGRENIYMNGSIMGMTKREITARLDEIIDFAGVERYIDTPVKRYSSGMTVRLGFAIAAHLDPEILVVDEVLAVGDAEFQKKAIGKMQDVSRGQGRTVLFVSHNMGSMKQLCNNGVLLKNGCVQYTSTIDNVISKYMEGDNDCIDNNDLTNRANRDGNGKIRFSKILFLNKQGEAMDAILMGEYVKIRLFYEETMELDFEKLHVELSFRDEYQNNIVSFISDEMGSKFTKRDEKYIDLEIPQLLLRGSMYSIRLMVAHGSTAKENICDDIVNAATLNVISHSLYTEGIVYRSFKSAYLPDASFK